VTYCAAYEHPVFLRQYRRIIKLPVFVHLRAAARIALGDELPFKDSSLDYVLSSHVIEHFFNPIKALLEWNRVIKK